jgi:hypothetical protein
MTKKATTKQHTYEEAVNWLREHGFEILDAPATKDRVFLKKYTCSAAIEKAADGTARLFAKPGYLISGEISRLVDKGYQKFLKTSKAEVPATADPPVLGRIARGDWRDKPVQRIFGYGERSLRL